MTLTFIVAVVCGYVRLLYKHHIFISKTGVYDAKNHSFNICYCG